MRVERCEEEFFGTHTNIKNHNTSFLLFSSDEEDPLRYDFEIINHHQAILHTEAMSCPELVIDEFLFYSGFISHIETVDGRIIYHQPKKKIISLEISKIQPSQLYINEKKLDRLLTWIKSPEETVDGRIIYHQPKKKIISLEISKIQPSQLYINEKKLDRLLTWIKSPEEVIIPVIRRGTQWVSVDGHTRLKAAQLLGFKQIYVYVDEFEPYIDDFIQFCQQDKKFIIYDLPVISNEDYQIQWCLFCDQYFQQKEGYISELSIKVSIS